MYFIVKYGLSMSRNKQGPLRATVPLLSATATKPFAAGAPTIADDSPKVQMRGSFIRRTASLDAIYLKGLFPRETLFLERDRATQTDKSSSLDSLQTLGVEEKIVKLSLRQRRRSCSRDPIADSIPGKSSSSPKAVGGAPTKSSRSSEEGLNLEIELYATNLADSQCDRLNEPIPEGRKAPVAELIQEGSYSRSQKNRHQSANQNSSDSPLRNSISPSPGHLDTPQSETEDSQSSSPDQDRMISGSSPHINRFSSRAPPDGCERILSKSVPILRPIPREARSVSSHPNALYTLKPSSHSAFESLRRQMEERELHQQRNVEGDDNKDRDSPKVPDNMEP